MGTFQTTFSLTPFPRGFHLITRTIESKITEINMSTGIVHIFIHHTSASLTINENADTTVRGDFERHFNVLVPENASYYRHTDEGPDDMPAHLKSSLLGSSVTMPLTNGKLNLGTWQGIYLCEHRNHAAARKITITVMGE